MSDYVMYWKIIYDILSQIRKDYLKPKCVTTYIHFLSMIAWAQGGGVGVIPVITGYAVSGRYWQDVKDKEYQCFSINGAHC